VDSKTRRQLRQIAHHLHPVVIVGDGGVSETLIAETQRALNDHELIKVRIHSESREDRADMSQALAQACEAEIIQRIGKVIVLFKPNTRPKAHLSNLIRYA